MSGSSVLCCAYATGFLWYCWSLFATGIGASFSLLLSGSLSSSVMIFPSFLLNVKPPACFVLLPAAVWRQSHIIGLR